MAKGKGKLGHLRFGVKTRRQAAAAMTSSFSLRPMEVMESRSSRTNTTNVLDENSQEEEYDGFNRSTLFTKTAQVSKWVKKWTNLGDTSVKIYKWVRVDSLTNAEKTAMGIPGGGSRKARRTKIGGTDEKASANIGGATVEVIDLAVGDGKDIKKAFGQIGENGKEAIDNLGDGGNEEETTDNLGGGENEEETTDNRGDGGNDEGTVENPGGGENEEETTDNRGDEGNDEETVENLEDAGNDEGTVENLEETTDNRGSNNEKSINHDERGAEEVADHSGGDDAEAFEYLGGNLWVFMDKDGWNSSDHHKVPGNDNDVAR